MKEFRKNQEGLFVCEECEKTIVYMKGLSKHVNALHNLKIYYDKWLKSEDDGLCKICGKETEFTGFRSFYKHTCCKECENKYKFLKTSESCLKKYGTENYFLNPDFREKSKETCLQKYGVEYVAQFPDIINKTVKTKYEKAIIDPNYWININKKALETYKKRVEQDPSIELKRIEKTLQTLELHYGKGITNPFQVEEVKEQIKITNLERWGYEYVSSSPIIKKRREETNLERWGFKSAMQNEDVKETIRNTCMKKYNVENILKHQPTREKINKTIKEHKEQDPLYQQKINEKTRNTYFENTGYYHNTQNPYSIRKKKETLLQKYNVTNFFQSDIYKRLMIDKGLMRDNLNKSEYYVYAYKVHKITNEHIKIYGEKYLGEKFYKLQENINISDCKIRWSKDHKYSINEGFRNNIPPEIIGSIVNIDIMTISENSAKNFKCSISLEELKNEYYQFLINEFI